MTRGKPQYEMLLEAMLKDYEESKAANPDEPKVSWTHQDLSLAITTWFDEVWDGQKITNALSTLRYRGIVESVGKANLPGLANKAKLWCPIKVMEMETEPTEKPEPEPAPIATPALVRVESFEPVVYESAAPTEVPVEIAPDEHDFADEPAQPVSAPVIPVIPVQQGKRKRRNGEPAVTPEQDLMRTVHQMARTVSEISRQLTETQRMQRESQSFSITLEAAVQSVKRQLSDFDREVGNSLREWQRLAVESDDLQVAAFKAGFVSGWNQHREVHVGLGETPPKLSEENVQADFKDDHENGVRTFDARPSAELLEPLNQQQINEAAKRVVGAASMFNNQDPGQITRKIIRGLIENMESLIRDKAFSEHEKGRFKAMPDWVMRCWKEIKDELLRNGGGTQNQIIQLQKALEFIEYWKVGRSSAKIKVQFHGTAMGQPPLIMEWLILMDLAADKMKAFPYNAGYPDGESVMLNGHDIMFRLDV